jgi:hypothetical protein
VSINRELQNEALLAHASAAHRQSLNL